MDMPVEFEIKKVPMETLGEYLTEIRKQMNLTLEEVSKQTGIFEKFVYNIEQGRYNQLPPDVYVRGFLKKLAEVYSIPPSVLLDQYQKERGVAESVARDKITPVKGWKSWFEKVSITPKLITLLAVVVFGTVASGYVLFQIFAINKTPSLEVFEPKNDSVIKGSKVSVSGRTEIGMTVTINNQNILVNRDGTFTTEVGMVPGQKDLIIESQNKLGKKNTKIVGIRVEEPRVLSANVVENTEQTPIQLELKFTRETRIELKRDGIQISEELIPAGATKKITANEEIIVTTSDAGSTSAIFNGTALGTLGKRNETLSVPFNRESTNIAGLDLPETAPTDSIQTNNPQVN